MICEFDNKIFSANPETFENLALEIFHFQYQNNEVYADFVNSLQFNVNNVSSITSIPFLPIQFFKDHSVKTTSFLPQAIFESSTTTQTVASRHLVKDTALYKKAIVKIFEIFYGKLPGWCIIGLLPSYLERKNSSLVEMVKEFIDLSGHTDSGFYMYEHDKLCSTLSKLEEQKQKTLLIGVTFALLDFVEKYQLPLKHTVVMETGGMKGRRRELTRNEVHDILKAAFTVSCIHSEYGMTELLSQAYSTCNGTFECAPWMRILLREEDDPLEVKTSGTGVINVIDLANLYSCAFIATDDVGKLYENETFEVLGRLDNSDIRGCGLMVE